MMHARLLFAARLAFTALPVRVAAYSQQEAIEFAHLSAAAYCPAAAPAWRCGVHCERVPGMHAVRWIDDNHLGAHAYVGRLGGLCVLAFRGTDSTRAWAQDLRSIYLKPLPGCSFRGRRCEVGSGFYSDYRALAGRVKDSLAAIGCHKSSALAVTGHSLGGALATLASFELRRSGYHVAKCYTFGQPRVGNAAFASAFNKAMRSVPVYRVSKRDDPIIYMPPRGPFHHVGREVFYPGESFSGYILCDGSGEDRRCSGRHEGLEMPLMLASCFSHNTCGHLNYLRPALGAQISTHSCRRRLSNASNASNSGPSPPQAQATGAPPPMAAPSSAPTGGATPAPAILFP